MLTARASGLALLAILALRSSPALGNGGEVYQEYGGAGGQIRPLQETVIRLLREDLSLRLVDEEHYAVQADYVLANPGPEKEIRYGVPIEVGAVSYKEEGEGRGRLVKRTQVEVARRTQQMASSVRVTLGGAAGRCSYVDGWCVLTLRIPHGEQIPLRLTYVSEYVQEFVGADGDRWSPVQNGGHHNVWGADAARILKYPLAPAGTWAGVPERLTIAITSSLAAPFDSFRMAKATGGESPFVFHREGDAWRTELRDANLRELQELLAVVLLLDRGGRRPQLTVRASSSIPPSGSLTYGPENLLDSRYATAWCVNTPAHGVGEWVEMEVPAPFQLDGRDAQVVGGYAKTEKAYRANGRVKALGVSACGGGPRLASAAVKDGFEEDMWQEVRPGGATGARPRCLRFEILEVEPGETSTDVCLTELHPGLVR